MRTSARHERLRAGRLRVPLYVVRDTHLAYERHARAEVRRRRISAATVYVTAALIGAAIPLIVSLFSRFWR